MKLNFDVERLKRALQRTYDNVGIPLIFIAVVLTGLWLIIEIISYLGGWSIPIGLLAFVVGNIVVHYLDDDERRP